MDYFEKFYNQRRNALQRGIEWQFTFEEWLDWWGDEIEKRGRRKGQLVMARFNDEGPYHPSNVRKAMCSENCSEAVKGRVSPNKGRKASEETKLKMSNKRLGKKVGPRSEIAIENMKKAQQNRRRLEVCQGE